MPTEYSKKKHWASRVLIAVTAIMATLFLAVGLWLSLPYIGAKGKLLGEQSRIALPYKPAQQIYISGQCLDNCPSLETTYNIPDTKLGAEREVLVNLLRDRGYIFDSPSEGDNTILAHQGKFSLYLGFGGPALSASTLNEPADDSRIIQKLVFTLDYSP